MSALLQASVIEILESAIRLDIGATSGVQIGMRFVILNDGKKTLDDEKTEPIRAIIEISNVYDDTSIAKIFNSSRITSKDLAKRQLSGAGIGALTGFLLAPALSVFIPFAAFVAAAGAALGLSIPSILDALTQETSVHDIKLGDIAIQVPTR